MDHELELAYADRLGQFFSGYSSISPVAGRLLGYLVTRQPEQKSINELAKELRASRSAIVGAVQVLENRHVLKRTRLAGNRNDLIGFDISGFESRGFAATSYLKLAALFKEGLDIASTSTDRTTRRARLQELIDFAEFLSERMPMLQKEWLKQRDETNRS